MTLYAEGIPLNLNVDERQPTFFYLNVDGLKKADAIKRAFWFRTVFRSEGNRQPVTEDNIPRVRFKAERFFPKDLPAILHVEFAVDNAPRNAKLTFQLLREAERQILAEWSAPAKDRRLGFDIKSDSGTLWFEASEKDWVQDFKVNGVSGPCLLKARFSRCDRHERR